MNAKVVQYCVMVTDNGKKLKFWRTLIVFIFFAIVAGPHPCLHATQRHSKPNSSRRNFALSGFATIPEAVLLAGE